MHRSPSHLQRPRVPRPGTVADIRGPLPCREQILRLMNAHDQAWNERLLVRALDFLRGNVQGTLHLMAHQQLVARGDAVEQPPGTGALPLHNWTLTDAGRDEAAPLGELPPLL